VTSQTIPPERYGIASYDGNISRDYDPICTKKDAFCGLVYAMVGKNRKVM